MLLLLVLSVDRARKYVYFIYMNSLLHMSICVYVYACLIHLKNKTLYIILSIYICVYIYIRVCVPACKYMYPYKYIYIYCLFNHQLIQRFFFSWIKPIFIKYFPKCGMWYYPHSFLHVMTHAWNKFSFSYLPTEILPSLQDSTAIFHSWKYVLFLSHLNPLHFPHSCHVVYFNYIFYHFICHLFKR